MAKKRIFFFQLIIFFNLLVLIMFIANTCSGQGMEEYVCEFVDAQTGKPLPDIKVVFRKGGHEVEGVSNKEGLLLIRNFPFTEDDIKKRLVEKVVIKKGSNPLYFKVSFLNEKIPLSFNSGPPPVSKKYRIALSWGKKPKDLDAHLLFGEWDSSTGRLKGWNNPEYDIHHVFYGNKKYSKKKGWGKIKYVVMDRDDRRKEGPETITINEVIPGMRYFYSVRDHSNKGRSRSEALSSESNAKVYVYPGKSDEPIRVYEVPKNDEGNLWRVFYINENGEVIDATCADRIYDTWHIDNEENDTNRWIFD